jgi:type I restriction enzyme, S subunit
MNSDTKNRMPKLRFPDFKNEEEWQIATLDDVGILLKGKGISKSDIAPNGAQPCIRYGELYTTYKEVISSVVSFTNVNKEDLVLSETKDVIIPSSGETREDIATASCVMNAGVAFGGDLNIIRSTIDGVYLAYYITHVKKRAISKLAQGDAVVHLYLNQLRKLDINFPKLQAEQQKIAACLSSSDELITAESQKLDALIAHKKGLMQQLFPAEGETAPKRRFKEFIDRGGWRKVALGTVIDIKGRIGYRGYTIEDIVSKGEGAISLSPSNFRENGSLDFEKSTYISWAKYDESPEIMLNEGFTVLVKTGSSYGKVALVKNLPEKTTINPQIVVLKPLNVNPVFLFLIVKHSTVQKQIKETVVGGAIPTLSQESISKFEVSIPGLKEQQKIASCFSFLDVVITAQKEKIEALKVHKKGLIQQLFPNINELYK